MEISDLNLDPVEQFKQWYVKAKDLKEGDCDAMALATATKTSLPSVRYVLYKGISENGFLFYTNYESRKAQELFSNPHAALAIYWPKSYRQVRIEGIIEKISSQESAQYFRSRERDSQLGAWASKQSAVISNREELLLKYLHFKKQFQDKEIPCPEFWGGFRLSPQIIEFWQGQSHRLSDRFCYQRDKDKWIISRLAP